MLNLILTSDFPSTANAAVVERIRKGGPSARIAWVPPFTRSGRERFPAAQELFASHGFSGVEYCDIDAELNQAQLDSLDEYDVVYLTGGDPLGFRRNMLTSGLSAKLRERLAAGRVVVASSGGSMQVTPNVSLFRLLTSPLGEVVRERDSYDALGVVDFELLPHLNRLEAPFLETVRLYSEQVSCAILALADGAAVLPAGDGGYRCVGHAEQFLNGARTYGFSNFHRALR